MHYKLKAGLILNVNEGKPEKKDKVYWRKRLSSFGNIEISNKPCLHEVVYSSVENEPNK